MIVDEIDQSASAITKVSQNRFALIQCDQCVGFLKVAKVAQILSYFLAFLKNFPFE